MLDRASINMMVSAVLDSPLPTRRKGPPVPLKELIQSICAPLIHEEIMEYINKYEQHIAKVSNRRKYYLHDEVNDCKQFVYSQLIRNYHKIYSFSDLEKVTASIIKRKIIDFSKTRNCNKKSIILESELKSDDGDERGYLDFNSEFITERSLDMSPDADMLKTLQADLLDSEIFTDDEIKLLKQLFVECEDNPFGLLERLNKLNNCEDLSCRYREILTKIKKNFNMEKYL